MNLPAVRDLKSVFSTADDGGVPMAYDFPAVIETAGGNCGLPLSRIPQLSPPLGGDNYCGTGLGKRKRKADRGRLLLEQPRYFAAMKAVT